MSKQDLPYEKHTRMLIEMGRHPQGLMIADKWVEAKPKDPEAWFCKSVCEMMLMRQKIALESARKSIELKPGDARLQAQGARCMVAAGAVMEGLKLARKLAARENKNPHILDTVANTISNAGEHEEALQYFEAAIALNPNIPQYYTNYGTVLQFCRRTEEAEAAHRKAIELYPEDFRAYWLLGGLRKAKHGDNHVEWFDKTLKAHEGKLQARTALNFALAKQNEDLEKYDEAFHHLEDGAKAVLEHSPYSEASNFNLLAKFRDVFSLDLIASQPAGHGSQEPIFIVGMRDQEQRSSSVLSLPMTMSLLLENCTTSCMCSMNG